MLGPVIWKGPGGSELTLVMRVSGPTLLGSPVPPVPNRNWSCGGRPGSPPGIVRMKATGGFLHAGEIRRRQGLVEHLARRAGADEEVARAVRRRDDLELMPLGEIRPGRAVSLDDALRQQVEHALVLALRHIGREQMVEAAVLADDDDHVLDRTRGLGSCRRPCRDRRRGRP